MRCIIDQVVGMVKVKPRKVKVIKRYLKMKYNIHIDKEVLRKRLNRTINNTKWETV